MRESERGEPTVLSDETLSTFLAGFDLAARRTKDGKLVDLFKGKAFPYSDWPEEIAIAGNVYTLEDVVKGDDGYESAMYV
jgi:hypothetical protein